MWQASVLLIGLLGLAGTALRRTNTLFVIVPVLRLCRTLESWVCQGGIHVGAGRHRQTAPAGRANTGPPTALALACTACTYPIYMVTFNDPGCWDPRWYFVQLPEGQRAEEVRDFVASAMETAKYAFKTEDSGTTSARLTRTSPRGSSMRTNLSRRSTSTDTNYPDTEEDEVLQDFRAQPDRLKNKS